MYTVELFEYDLQGRQVAYGVMNYEDKETAWNDFSESIGEHFRKDFWDDFDWNDILVESIHFDEAGYNTCILHKWEGFDEDVSLAWKVGNTRYKSLKELWEALPEFKDHHKVCDVPYIDSSDGEKIAYLDIETNLNKQ